MIGQHLGHTIDIHGGGQDLIFPHHENEIAQGTCASGALYCRTWVHNSFVTVDGEKMSKSLGNVLLVRDLLERAPGEAIRLALLSTHYRRPLDWNTQRLLAAKQTLTRYYESLAKVAHIPPLPQAEPDPEVVKSLKNDLNVPGALARLRVLLTQVDDADTDARRAHAKSVLLASSGIIGLLQQSPQAALTVLRPAAAMASASSDDTRIKTLLAEREQARRDRDFSKADALREALEAAGFTVEDTPDGPRLRRAPSVPA
jgi:cysteinyl-tRNA synthetase